MSHAPAQDQQGEFGPGWGGDWPIAVPNREFHETGSEFPETKQEISPLPTHTKEKPWLETPKMALLETLASKMLDKLQSPESCQWYCLGIQVTHFSITGANRSASQGPNSTKVPEYWQSGQAFKEGTFCGWVGRASGEKISCWLPLYEKSSVRVRLHSQTKLLLAL